MDIRVLIRDEVLAQKAYAVEQTACPIKLDANENPLAIPEPLREQFAARLASIPLNRYPEAGSPALVGRFAKDFGVGEDQVILGNGSDELIQILCTAVARPGAEVMIPFPSFAMYRISALNAGCRVAMVPLDGEFDLDLAAMLARVATNPPALITSPAQQTDRTVSAANESRRSEVSALKSWTGLFHFSGQTFRSQGGTESGHPGHFRQGLAAMRIAFTGSPELSMNSTRASYNMNASQAAAGFI
jgi:histidinol-phosphate/aromatic aminotransferase/cobyric acid decarboxylase-like protein